MEQKIRSFGPSVAKFMAKHISMYFDIFEVHQKQKLFRLGIAFDYFWPSVGLFGNAKTHSKNFQKILFFRDLGFPSIILVNKSLKARFLQNGVSTSSLPPFIVDLLTSKVYPREGFQLSKWKFKARWILPLGFGSPTLPYFQTFFIFSPLFFFCNWILHIWNRFYTWSQSKISLLSPLIIGLKLTFSGCCDRRLPYNSHVHSHLNYYIYII